VIGAGAYTLLVEIQHPVAQPEQSAAHHSHSSGRSV